jgi:hypothetical protein
MHEVFNLYRESPSNVHDASFRIVRSSVLLIMLKSYGYLMAKSYIEIATSLELATSLVLVKGGCDRSARPSLFMDASRDCKSANPFHPATDLLDSTSTAFVGVWPQNIFTAQDDGYADIAGHFVFGTTFKFS